MTAQPFPRLRSLTLTLTERCNLRCSYCSVPVERGRAMSQEVADAAVDLLARHADEGSVTLSFYGGEPFLAVGAMKRAVDRSRAARGGKRHLRVLVPTNGLLVRGEALAACRDEGLDLAVSIDGVGGPPERAYADGSAAADEMLASLPGILALEPTSRVLARMTVTPENVGRLASNVRALSRLGFRRIVIQPAYERAWDDEAVAAWGREHGRIGTWLVGARAAGVCVPDLPGLRAVAERLALGRGRSSCGAGKRLAAVSTDGGLYPCYRLVFRGDDASCRLGDVAQGFTNRAALEAFAAFDPAAARPEDGACASCPAEAGCVHSCPALGLEMLGELEGVPAVACRLMRAEVEAMRPFAARLARPPARPRARLAATALVAMAAIGAAATACSGSVDVPAGSHGAQAGGSATGAGGFPGSGGASSSAAGGAIGTGGGFGTGGAMGGGICDFPDAGGGVCPVEVDGGYGGGVCPYEEDAGYGGGVCPVEVDGGYGGGVCPPPEPEDAGYGGGVCPAPAEDGGYWGGGVC